MASWLSHDAWSLIMTHMARASTDSELAPPILNSPESFLYNHGVSSSGTTSWGQRSSFGSFERLRQPPIDAWRLIEMRTGTLRLERSASEILTGLPFAPWLQRGGRCVEDVWPAEVFRGGSLAAPAKPF